MKRFFSLSFLALLFFVSCQNNADNKYAPALTDSTSVTGFTGDSVKLVKTAGIRFKVKKVEQSTRAVSALAQQLGGAVYNLDFQAAEGGRKELKISEDSLLVLSTTSPQAEITVRMPAQNLEAFLFGVSDIGYYTGSSQLKLDDRSLIYLANALKQKTRTDVLAKQPAGRSTVAGN
ncbi:MAG TPA: DUF4349 domain-containing protein, partial [Flavisolibacter sp.]|nr:DUF4349 domain-containing protein [Flavisolibacter sp.]